MSAATRLTNFLNLSQTPYRLVPHRHTETAADSAHAAHVPSTRVVKSVLLRDRADGHYLMALAPACNRVVDQDRLAHGRLGLEARGPGHTSKSQKSRPVDPGGCL